MKDFKGTPGPWTVKDYGHALAIECKVDNIEHTVVTDHFCYPDFKQHGSIEKLANAHLVSSAPDLLEALQNLVNLHLCEQEGISSGKPTSAMWLEAVDKAQEAIDKALGGTDI